MRVTFDHAVDEAVNIRTFYFKPEGPVQYTAGQYTELTLPHDNPDERGIKRWFTFSSSPTDELLSITTKYAGKGKSSSYKQKLFDLTPGIEVHMSDAMGDFVLPKLVQTPLIFVAGGIGVTPFHSILSWLGSTMEQRPIKFIYAVRSEDEIIFQPTFDRAGQHVTVVVSEPSPAWGGERGQVTAELVVGLEKPSDDTLVYVSGPEQMVEALHKQLYNAGLSKKQLVGDFFPGYASV